MKSFVGINFLGKDLEDFILFINLPIFLPQGVGNDAQMYGFFATGCPKMQSSIKKLTSFQIEAITIIGKPCAVLEPDFLDKLDLPLDEFFEEGFRIFQDLWLGKVVSKSAPLLKFDHPHPNHQEKKHIELIFHSHFFQQTARSLKINDIQIVKLSTPLLKITMIRSVQSVRNILSSFASSKSFIDLEEKYGCHNYSPLPVVIEKGEGIYMYDCEGKKYFDFLSAYSAVNQGHCHPRILKTFIEQSQKLTLTSRAVFNNRLGKLEEKLHQVFGYEKSLMMNSGVEAGESAIKIVRRWGYAERKIQPDQATVLFAKGNFWGRTIAACASSDDPQRYTDFGPFGGLNFELIDYGDLNALENALKANPNIVAYMVEPIQGERGVVLPPKGYLSNAKKILQKYNALLICDEIQTGLGRTGKLLCTDHDGVRPDLVLLGKALSGGFYPVSAVLCDDKIMKHIKPGQHGSTYGGNPLGSETAMTALDVILDEKLSENSLRLGEVFKKSLSQILGTSKVEQIRGSGLFVGAQFKSDSYAYQLSQKLLENGLIAKPTHKNIIRFSPPLVHTDQTIKEALGIIEKSWNAIQ